MMRNLVSKKTKRQRLIEIVNSIMIGLLLLGCSDADGYFDVGGQILDRKTRQPVANRRIIVYELESRDARKSISVVGEFKTDSLGKFNYHLRKSKLTYFYNFQIIGDSAYSISNNIVGMTELNQWGKSLRFRMQKLTDFSLKIERRTLKPAQDTLFVSWQTKETDCESLYPYKITNLGTSSTIPLRWIGGNVKSVVNTKVFADEQTIVQWKLFRSGRASYYNDTIFCKRGSTNVVSFQY